jgi:hypothetical protein
VQRYEKVYSLVYGIDLLVYVCQIAWEVTYRWVARRSKVWMLVRVGKRVPSQETLISHRIRQRAVHSPDWRTLATGLHTDTGTRST